MKTKLKHYKCGCVQNEDCTLWPICADHKKWLEEYLKDPYYPIPVPPLEEIKKGDHA